MYTCILHSVSVEDIPLRQACGPEDECAGKNTQCASNGICTCEPDFYEHGQFCSKKKIITLPQRTFSLHLTLKVLVTTIDSQWERMGGVGSARYEPALLPPCPTIRVLSYSN